MEYLAALETFSGVGAPLVADGASASLSPEYLNYSAHA